jgi:hypothetical protein
MMGLFDSFLHPERGYKKAQQQFNQYYNQGQGYLNSYNQHGQEGYQNYAGAENALLNPEALLQRFLSSYQESPFAKQLEGEATQRGLNAASSLGLNGSSPALSAIQQGTTGIYNQDRENYLNRLLQQYLQGAGIAGNVYGTGAQAAGQQGQNALNAGNQNAQFAYGQQNAPGNLFGNIVGGVGGLLGGAAGAFLGGPAGAYLGNSLFGGGLPQQWSTTGGR